jgi:hypothetical protein
MAKQFKIQNSKFKIQTHAPSLAVFAFFIVHFAFASGRGVRIGDRYAAASLDTDVSAASSGCTGSSTVKREP